MKFTKRTYRVAINRSLSRERVFEWAAKRSESIDMMIGYMVRLNNQEKRTAQLRVRKRRERK